MIPLPIPAMNCVMDCGCRVIADIAPELGIQRFQMSHCPLHTAAPELLAMLETVVFQLGTRPKHSVFFNLVDDCRDAIAKAKGGA